MHRASAILTNTRVDKELSLEEVSKKTKIPTRYLRAIETEDRSNFPSEPYCSMIVKDYADFLGLNGANTLRLFCRDISTKQCRQNQFIKPVSFTPQSAITLATIASFIFFFSYLVSEYLKFNRPPKLEVNWPREVVNSSLDISGITDSEATIKINDRLAIVDQDGNFKQKLDIAGTNTTIIVQARSRSGQTAVEEKVY